MQTWLVFLVFWIVSGLIRKNLGQPPAAPRPGGRPPVYPPPRRSPVMTPPERQGSAPKRRRPPAGLPEGPAIATGAAAEAVNPPVRDYRNPVELTKVATEGKSSSGWLSLGEKEILTGVIFREIMGPPRGRQPYRPQGFPEI